MTVPTGDTLAELGETPTCLRMGQKLGCSWFFQSFEGDSSRFSYILEGCTSMLGDFGVKKRVPGF